MSLYDDFKRYRDESGLNGLGTTGTSGSHTDNGALFTMEYLICLLGNPDTSDAVKQSELARLREVYLSLERFPGVSVRRPNDDDFDSMDNANSIATFSGLYDNGNYSKRSLSHGSNTRAEGIDQSRGAAASNKWYRLACILNLFRAPRYFWNNNTPTLFCFAGWHGRSPSQVPYLKLTAGKWIGPLGCLFVLIAQFAGCFSSTDNTDARKLPYVNWQFLKTKSFILRLFKKLWCWILIKQYPNGMKDVYSMYYQDVNHPLRAYTKSFEP